MRPFRPSPAPRVAALASLLVVALAAASLAGCSTDAPDGSADAAASADAAGAEDAAAGADAGSGADTAPTCTPKTALKSLDAKRPAAVHVPDDWDGCTPLPLVVLLHGYGANGTIQDLYLGVSALVSELDFILLIPEGSTAPDGKQFWNATNACCNFYGAKVDDVGYITGLIDSAVAELGADPERVYLYGHSNGGFMSYRIACEAADKITGVASLAGAVTATAAACTPSRGVHVLQMHGTDDGTIPYAGSKAFPSVDTTIERWRSLNACKGSPEALPAVDYDGKPDGPETVGQRWQGCKDGSSVALWTMQGSAHIPGVNAAFKRAALETILGWTRDKP